MRITLSSLLRFRKDFLSRNHVLKGYLWEIVQIRERFNERPSLGNPLCVNPVPVHGRTET